MDNRLQDFSNFRFQKQQKMEREKELQSILKAVESEVRTWLDDRYPYPMQTAREFVVLAGELTPSM